MRKIFEKSYVALITIFFTLFIVIIRLEANNNNINYFVGLIIAGLFIGIVPFLINSSKKMEARRWYLISMVSISLELVFKGIYYFFINSTATKILIYIECFILAVAITSTIFACILAVKDSFKKDYTIQSIDLDDYKMAINMIYYLFGVYFICVYTGKAELLLNINFEFVKITFSNNDFAIKGLFIGLVIYLVFYIIIEIIKYFKFEKITIDKNQRKFK